MFKFLKEKLKGAISKLSKKAEEESSEEIEDSAEEKEGEIKKLEEEKKKLEREEKKVAEEIKKAEQEKKKAEEKAKLAEKKRKEEEKKKKEKEAKKEAEKKKPKEKVIGEKPKTKKPSEKPQKEGKKAEEKEKKAAAEQEKIEKERAAEEAEKEEQRKRKEEEERERKEREAEEKAKEEARREEERRKEEERKAEEEAKKKEQEIKELEKKKEELRKQEEEIKAEEEEAKKEKKGFFAKLTDKITKTKVSAENFEKLFWDLELALLENNVAVEVIGKIKEDLKKNIVENPVARGKIQPVIMQSLKKSISEVLSAEQIDVVNAVKEKKEKPYVICFVGINGSGKTTSIAKVAKYLQNNNIQCVMAASDTFRAAAIDQLQMHADNLGIKLIKHDYGSDAAAVAFDAVKHAQAKEKEVVLIDTAGRMHSNANLMDEMKKIVRVAKPDLKVFVGESIVGNDCIEQAKNFDNAVGIDAIMLSKADVDEKGGAAISISYVTKKPIIFIGTGQEYGDIKPFQPEVVLESLGLE